MAKPIDVANYFLYLSKLKEDESVTNLKLQKLVYYAQGYYSAIFDKYLFQDDIYAWAHGPVVPDLYHFFKKYGKNSIETPDNFDAKCLTDEERELIDEVFDVYGQFSAWKLRNLTHEEKPWMDHENDAGLIPKQEIKDYFKTQVNH